MIGFVGIYIAIPPGNGRGGSLRKLRTLSFVFLPFAVVGVLFVVLAASVGYSWQELIFFIFPVDIIADHRAVGRIGGIAAGILPAFLGCNRNDAVLLPEWMVAERKSKDCFISSSLDSGYLCSFFSHIQHALSWGLSHSGVFGLPTAFRHELLRCDG